MPLRFLDSREEKASTAVEFALLHPRLRTNTLYIQSVPAILDDRTFKFVKVEDPDQPNRPLAVGLLRLYSELFFNMKLVGAEALWFRDGDLAAQMPAWQELAEGILDLCVAPESLANDEAFEELLRQKCIANSLVSDERPRLKALGNAGTYSALAAGAAPTGPFSARVARIYNSAYFRGTLRPAGDLLYRGEGRLSGDGWDCKRLEDVGLRLIEQGFATRGKATFGGSVSEQILQQGYVPQGTVSLTVSFDVAAHYATSGGKRAEGIVFALDTGRIAAPIFDSYTTMVSRCRWMPDPEFDTLSAVVAELGVKEGGVFLARCHQESRQRAMIIPSPRLPPQCLSEPQLTRLHERGVSRSALDRLHRELDAFWMGVFSPTIALDTDGQEVDESPVHSLLYVHAFEKVRGPLV